jgi:hypothetical protein
LFGKSDAKRQLRKNRHRREDNTKIGLKGTGYRLH